MLLCTNGGVNMHGWGHGMVCLTPHMMYLVDLAQLREPPANSLILRAMADALRPPLAPLYEATRLQSEPDVHSAQEQTGVRTHTHMHQTFHASSYLSVWRLGLV